ncbi:MAG: amino acid adenylation domain-containing protein, partial [Clostridiales bacterium]|nr:amino acid adenylation domain-containing protein [Clostridiales bacterium]
TLGVKPNDMVAIKTERSLEMIVGIYGILKSGGAYVPIDATYPDERIKFMLEDCEAKAIVLYGSEQETELAKIDLRREDWTGDRSNPEHVNKPEDLAYCIYTSGTTGKPKGVLLEHHGIVSMQKYLKDLYEVTEKDVVLQFANCIFDASVWERTMSLYTGAELLLISSEKVTDSEAFEKYVREKGATISLLPPQYFRQLSSNPFRILTTGGSAASREIIEQSGEEGRYINAYGPTENTVLATHWEKEKDGPIPSVIPIGKPIYNTKIYILDKGSLCGIGVPGELCITGDGLARGYLNRPELTEEKFVKNPYGEGRMYRSGDLARWLPDGNIEYLGRIDEQVKIRGFRIELGEIESRIRELDGVTDCAVIAREDRSGEKAIYAYYVSDEELSVSEIRDELGKTMPDYMIPTYLMRIESIPVTRNGKLDKRALPEIEAGTGREYVAPNTEKEKIICEAFEKILNVKNVGIKDNFFELGGDSIKAIRIISILRNAGYKVAVKDILTMKTVERISMLVEKAEQTEEYEQGEVNGVIKKTPIIRAFDSWNLKKPEHFNQSMMINVEGKTDENIKAAVKALVKHHDILRAVYRDNELVVLPVSESKLCDFFTYDYRGVSDVAKKVEATCTQIQAGIDLENGPLVKIAVFETDDDKVMMFCIHHLAVDGVSWRILIEDFETAVKQLEDGKGVALPKKTASYALWSKKLEEYGERLSAGEKEYWEKMSEETAGILVQETSGEELPYYGTVEFTKETSEKLLKQSGKACGARTNEVLLSGIAKAVGRMTGQKQVSVRLEGHGREKLHEAIAIDRTVGWFTNIYQLVFDCCEETRRSVIEAKEVVRRVPNGGLGYNFSCCEEKAADITFNYLGDLSALNLESKYNSGNAVAEENQTDDGILVNGQAADGIISFVVMSRKYGQDFLDEMCEKFKEAVEEAVEYCADAEETEKTASDYGITDMTSKEFERFLTETKGNVSKIYSLTPLQVGMLFHSMEDRESTGYVIQSAYRLEMEMDPETVREALELLSLRYEVLKTAFIYKGVTEPKQVIYTDRKPEVNAESYAGLTEEEKAERYSQLLKEDVKRGFDLQEDSLIRITVVEHGENDTRLVWSMHHIIMDGWCLGMLLEKFMSYYTKLSEGEDKAQMTDEIQQEKAGQGEYSEYISWLGRQDQEKAKEYWRELLSDYDNDCAVVSVGKPEPTEEQMRRQTITVDESVTTTLKKFAEQNGSTINTVAEIACGLMLQAYSGCKDVVFGKVVSGRNANIAGIEDMVGLFVNTIPVRVKADAGMTVGQLLVEQQKQGNESTGYDYYSLAEIQSETEQGSGLIKVLYVFENYSSGINVSEDTPNISVDSTREQTNYALSVTGYETEGKLGFDVMYDPNEYSDEEMHAVLERLVKICGEIAEKKDGLVEDIETVTEKEKKDIFEDFNNTAADYPREKTIVELFEEQVEKTPDNIAVVFGDESLTYSELNAKANQLARVLREDYGVKPDDFVVIIAERSLEMIVGIYGILKSGGAYVPIDPTYPEDRIVYILEDSSPKAVLTYHASLKSSIPVIDLANKGVFEGACENLEIVNKPEDTIYCIYTSGTTGKPKGVPNRNRGLINRIMWMHGRYPLEETDAILQKTTFTFDVSVWEIIWWSLVGAKVVMLNPGSEKSPEDICNAIGRYGVTHIHFVPSMLNMFLMDLEYNRGFDKLVSLKYVFASGEALSTDHLKSFNNLIRSKNPTTRLINFYGPTEASIDVTYFDCEYDYSILPIGRPINNTQIHIVQGNTLCGIGIPGELCIAGDGLARGYLNRPELTAEKFVKNPYGEGQMYHTGDLARWLPDGNIEYLGRLDEQVKIRGFRIELGEIESRIREIEAVKDCAVIAREDRSGEKAIYAYIVSDVKIDESNIRKELFKTLPNYMIPSYFMQIDSIPVTRNGKLDRKSLPSYKRVQPAKTDKPLSLIEAEVVSIVKEILNIDTVDVDDSFFDIGGNSLRSISLVTQMKKKGYTVSISEVMGASSIRDLCEMVSLDSESSDGGEEGLLSFDRYDDILKYIDEEYDRFDASIKASGEEIVYPFSPVQRILIFAGALSMRAVFKLDFKVDVPRLKKSLITLINEQGMLRTIVTKKGMSRYNTQFNSISDAEIPFIDASSLSEKEKADLDLYLRCLSQNRYKKMTKEMHNRVLYQMIIIKYDKDNWFFYMPVSHLIYDMYSADVLKTSLDRIYKNNAQMTGVKINQYSDYVRGLCQGPQNIDYDGLVDLMGLVERENNIDKCKETFKKRLNGVNFFVDLRFDDLNLNEEELWTLAYYVFNRVCYFEARSEKILFSTLVCQRRYGSESYYNTIGCFLDYVALCDSTDSPIDYQRIQTHLEKMADHMFNRIGMQYGVTGWFKYPKEGFELVKEVNKRSKKTNKLFIPVFDHLGMLDLVADVGDIQDDGRGNVHEVKKTLLSAINLGGVGFTGKSFYVTAFCSKGQGQAMRDFVQKELDEYVKRKFANKAMDRDDPNYMEYVQGQLMNSSEKKESAEAEKEEGAVSIK